MNDLEGLLLCSEPIVHPVDERSSRQNRKALGLNPQLLEAFNNLPTPLAHCALISDDSIAILSCVSTTKDKNILEEISIYVLTLCLLSDIVTLVGWT